MKNETEHRFTATHRHMVPPGVMSETHSHDWIWTVHLENGGVCPIYGWVANFHETRAIMAECTTAEHYEGTTEKILAGLIHELAWRLGPNGPTIVWSRLEEKPGQAAIYEPGKDRETFGPALRTRG